LGGVFQQRDGSCDTGVAVLPQGVFW